MKRNTKLEKTLKGTTFMLIIFILQLVLTLTLVITMLYRFISELKLGNKLGVIEIISFSLNLLSSIIDPIIIGYAYRGFKRGIRGWALFLIPYGVVVLIVNLMTFNIFTLSPLLIIAGFIGFKGKIEYTRIKLTKGHTINLRDEEDI